MTENKILQIPYGTRDVLPGEARAKRIVEDKIAANFLAWGYDEVETPTFEYLDTFSLGGTGVTQESMKFLDRNNRTLVLRSDMTTPLARMVATRLDVKQHVKRLCYIANIFRYEETQAGRQCEFCQAGVELMGAKEPMADAEVLAIAITSLQSAGLTDFTVSVGHAAFLKGLMEEAKLSEDKKEAVKKLVLEHNAVGLENLVKALKIKPKLKELFGKFFFLQGDVKLLKELTKVVDNKQSLDALKNLLDIYALAKAYNVEKYLSFDLSLIRNFDYYTGMVFEAYTPNIGFNICGGGRYDTMMKAFGQNAPATGFAMGIDRIILARRRLGTITRESTWDYFVAWTKRKQKEALAEATKLRAKGKTVKVATHELTKEDAEVRCKENNCRTLMFLK
jgi:ATP phosphoribosyltransferase regulatory subunit